MKREYPCSVGKHLLLTTFWSEEMEPDGGRIIGLLGLIVCTGKWQFPCQADMQLHRHVVLTILPPPIAVTWGGTLPWIEMKMVAKRASAPQIL